MERLDSPGKPRLLRLGTSLPGVRNKDSNRKVSRLRTRSLLMKSRRENNDCIRTKFKDSKDLQPWFFPERIAARGKAS